MHNHHFASITLTLLLLACSAAFSQRTDVPAEGTLRSPDVLFEGCTIAGPDTGRQTAFVSYRINQRFLTFVRGQSALGIEQYQSRAELSVEIQTSEKTSVARELRPIAAIRPSLPREGEELPDIQGIIMFTLPSGDFHAVAEVRDIESSRISLNRDLPLSRGRSSGPLTISAPILVDVPAKDSSGTERFTLVNRGGTLLFGASGGGVLLPIVLPAPGSPGIVHWTLEGQPADELFVPQTFRDSAAILIPGTLSSTASASSVGFTIRPDTSASAVLFVPLPLARLTPGQYTCSVVVTSGSSHGERQSRFDVAWPQRPLSLMRQELTIEALQHIIPPAEFEELKDESSSKAYEHLRRIWSTRNPDTARAYNPVFVEYYRRVDEAMRRFSSRNEPNGFKSDRGRILILFGPPSRSDRSLRSGSGPMETWTYDRLKKRFTFSDPDRSGVFVLIRSEEL